VAGCFSKVVMGASRRVIAALRSSGSLRSDLEPEAAADVFWL
jgi:hypothetical protein